MDRLGRQLGGRTALASEIPNEPPRRSRGRLGGSFVIQRGRALLNDWPPRIWGRAQDSGGGSVSRSRIPGSPLPGCSPLRRAPRAGWLASQGERFARRRTGRRLALGPEYPRRLAREDRVLVRPLAVPLQGPGPGPLRQGVEAGPLRGGEDGQPGGLARGQGPSGIRGRGRARPRVTTNRATVEMGSPAPGNSRVRGLRDQ